MGSLMLQTLWSKMRIFRKQLLIKRTHTRVHEDSEKFRVVLCKDSTKTDIALAPYTSGTLSHMLVEECMLEANKIAAFFCEKNSIMVPHSVSSTGRRYSLFPSLNESIGVSPYARFTSSIRRVEDLINHTMLVKLLQERAGITGPCGKIVTCMVLTYGTVLGNVHDAGRKCVAYRNIEDDLKKYHAHLFLHSNVRRVGIRCIVEHYDESQGFGGSCEVLLLE